MRLRLRIPKKPEKLIAFKDAVEKLTDRDYELFNMLYHFHPLSTTQIFRLLFKYPGGDRTKERSMSYCYRRLNLLAQECGFIEAGRVVSQNKIFDFHYFLTNRGIEALRRYWDAKGNVFTFKSAALLKVKTSDVPHEILVNEVYAQLWDWDSNFEYEWVTDYACYRYGYNERLAPDAQINAGDTMFLIEVDRNTEHRAALAHKLQAYARFMDKFRLDNREVKVHLVFMVEDKDYSSGKTEERVAYIKRLVISELGTYIAGFDFSVTVAEFNKGCKVLTDLLIPQAHSEHNLLLAEGRQGFMDHAARFGHSVAFMQPEVMVIEDLISPKLGLTYTKQSNSGYVGCHFFVECCAENVSDEIRVRGLIEFTERWRSLHPNEPYLALAVVGDIEEARSVVRLAGNCPFLYFVTRSDISNSIADHIYTAEADERYVIIKPAESLAGLFQSEGVVNG